MSILYALFWFAGLALILGVMLAAASMVFAVKTDERVPKVLDCLPGANCGGCGFAGCSACAEAIVRGDARVSSCTVGGQQTADRIADVMGVNAGVVRKMRAQVMCSGTHGTAKQKYIYDGPKDCAAAMRLGGGSKVCGNGCMGLGSCAAVCTHGAISVRNGVAAVDYTKCAGCGLCADTCPKNIIRLIPYESRVWVGCSSPDKGPVTKNACSAGCIGCRLCEKTCPVGAIRVNGSLAEIDYDKCTGCGACAEKCPRGIIRTSDGQKTDSSAEASAG